MTFKVPNDKRVRVGRFASDNRAGENGAFIIERSDHPALFRRLFVIATNGAGWEHVSVSVYGSRKNVPSWVEMDAIKRLFWDDEDPVFQLHPPRSTWVSNHDGCLHLWRPVDESVGVIPLPPAYLVGNAELGTDITAEQAAAELERAQGAG